MEWNLGEADNRFLQYLKSTGNIRQLNGVGLGLEVGSGLVPSYYLLIVITLKST